MVAPKPLTLPPVPVLEGDAAIVSQHLTAVAGGVTLLDQDFPAATSEVQFPEGTPLTLDPVSLSYKNLAGVTGPARVESVTLTAGDPPPPPAPPTPPQPAAIQEPPPTADPVPAAPAAADPAPAVTPSPAAVPSEPSPPPATPAAPPATDTAAPAAPAPAETAPAAPASV